MSEEQKKISREELYERIWTKPIVQLGKELGFTYVEMVKLCDRLNLPRPMGGYWYRLSHGGASEQPPLPIASPEMPGEIELPVKPIESAPEEPDIDEIPNAKLIEERETEIPLSTVQHAKRKEVPAAAEVAQPGMVQGASMKVSTQKKPEAPKREAEELPDRVELTREQLYQRIWSQPCRLLAASLGISDVALKKTCKRLGIPTPSLGYWAKLDAGQEPAKELLPQAQPGQDRTIVFDVAANKARRMDESLPPRPAPEEPQTYVSALPQDLTQIHPVANKHLQAMTNHKPDDRGIIQISRKELFRIEVSHAITSKLVAALHVLITSLERQGYTFKPGADAHESLRVIKGSDSLTLHCSEFIEEIQREPTDEEKRQPSWEWKLKSMQPSGRLTFEIIATPSLRGRRTWTETERISLESILETVCGKVGETFQRYELERQREIERAKQREEQQRRWEEERKREQERERLQAHESQIRQVNKDRRDILFDRSMQWVIAQQVEAFVNACEAQWRSAGAGRLTAEQETWIAWARAAIGEISPFNEGYPNPSSDGAFDGSKVQLGGPYPKARTLKTQPPPPEPNPYQSYNAPTQAPPQQFPFWLLHRRR